MMPGQHGTSLKDYTQALTTQLRLREVPGRTIGQIVAEVESHVRETGEDPVEAFGHSGSSGGGPARCPMAAFPCPVGHVRADPGGPLAGAAGAGALLASWVETHVADSGLGPVESFGEPGEYAAAYAAAAGPAPLHGGLRGRLRTLGVAVVGAFAGVAVGFGAMDLAGSVEITLRLLGMWLAILAVCLLVMSVLWPQLKRDTARSFTPRRSRSRFMLLGALTWLAGVAALVPIGRPNPGPNLVSVPGWVLFLAGALALVALVRTLGGDTVTDPRR